jgi:8-amino-7-oxononanoate synthase
LRGMPLLRFPHGDVRALRRCASEVRRLGRMPVVLADGYTPGDAQAPPLRAYAAIAAGQGGWLVLDDTQGLGVLGPDGGGSLRLHRLQDYPVLVGASLAKGFGAPLAVLAGPAMMIACFEQCSEARVHASPPSVAEIAAARRALRVNARIGPLLRRRLAAQVDLFRRRVTGAGLACHGGAFPVQVVPLPVDAGERLAQAQSLARTLQAVLLRTTQGLALGFLLRADHGEHEVARTAALLVCAMQEWT